MNEQKERVPSDKAVRQTAPSELVARTPKETRTPERGTDRRMESRSPEKVVEPARSPEKVQPKNKEFSPPDNVVPRAPEPKLPEKRTEQMKGQRNSEKGA